MAQTINLGLVTEGTTSTGCIAKLNSDTSVEDIRVGQFVTIGGEKSTYFSMVTDVRLAATSPDILLDPPASPLLREITKGTSTYGQIEVQPMLAMSEGDEAPRSVKNVPTHFSPVAAATQEDFTLVFGTEDPTHFAVGQPPDMDVDICLDLARFVERSNGIFGKSGTGKSFLTRLILAGVIQKRVASNLIFDMHNEYGWESPSESGTLVKGLRQLFPGLVLSYSIDPKSSRERGVQVDHEVTIGLSDISIADLQLLAGELDLSSPMIDSAFLMESRFGDEWIQTLRDREPVAIKDLAIEIGANDASLSALKRRLAKLTQFEFVRPESNGKLLDELVSHLQQGKHVVLEFGRYRSLLAYMLVANIITRKLHRAYVQQTERYIRTQKPEDKPRQLMITIEEAHKFLSPEAAKHNIFGEIARELRKFFVTLLVVDQRPSGIDSEVLSQIGTRITALLNDPHDIDAVFTGVAGSTKLKQILATLESKQQAMLLGHATPMPVVIRTREYGPEFYKSLGATIGKAKVQIAKQSVEELFG